MRNKTKVIAIPMLFSGELVRAMIGGNKTQTRRIMKPQPKLKDDGITHWWPSNIFQTMVTIDDPKQCMKKDSNS